MYNYFVINTKFVKFRNLNKQLSISISYINILELVIIQYTYIRISYNMHFLISTVIFHQQSLQHIPTLFISSYCVLLYLQQDTILRFASEPVLGLE